MTMLAVLHSACTGVRSVYRHDRDQAMPTYWWVVGPLVLAVLYKGYKLLAAKPQKALGVDEVLGVLTEVQMKELAEGTAEVEGVVRKPLEKGVAEAVLEAVTNRSHALKVIEEARSTRYDSSNDAHEALLERLWAALKPGVARSKRVTEEWEDLGFQGSDPATDFRGNGLLGLANLVFFAEHHQEVARKMIAEGGWSEKRQETMKWYSFAITGIHFTSSVTKEAQTASFASEFKACARVPLDLADLPTHPAIAAHSNLYSSLMASYHTLWLKHQPSVMEFNPFVAANVTPVLPSLLRKGV